MMLRSMFLMMLARQSMFMNLQKKAFKQFLYGSKGRGEEVLTKQGFRMHVSGTDVVANRIWVYKEFEPGLTRLISSLAKNCTVAFDVGCNIGYFSCLIKHVSPMVDLTCIDANPEMLEQCRKNLRLNGHDATLIQKAVGEKKGSQTLTCPVNHPSLATLGGSAKAKGEMKTISVDVERLDELLGKRHLGNIDLLKMDIEGYDLRALSTLDLAAARRINNIICEYSDQRLSQCGSTLGDLAKIPWIDEFELYAVLESSLPVRIAGPEDWPASKSETLWLRNRSLVN